ncbi:Pr6Pr family membrane protein [Chitinophaga sp. YIM B06452]|uniref:Pr6Pr family membrane protein n=1 Tax=Chitinophaga sp. YIM B06452 TaxID=3082158 RepID=UPI0031FEA00A
MKTPAKSLKTYAAAGALLGWLAVLSQLYLSLTVRTVSVAELLIRFIGYFTITTNTLAALCYTSFWLEGKGRFSVFLRKPSSVFAITVFIIIVGVVYNVILRFTWEPKGFQLAVDELLHSVLPVMFVFFWILFIPKHDLKMKDFNPWLLYPLVYITYVITLGLFTGHYPYPFADASLLGYPKALLNGAAMMAGFWACAWLLMGISQLGKRRKAEHV